VSPRQQTATGMSSLFGAPAGGASSTGSQGFWRPLG
jgi:hypothetical protein